MAMNTLKPTRKPLFGGGLTQRSRIQKQLLLLLLVSTALPVAVVGTYGTTAFTRVTSRSLLEDFEEESVTQASVIDTFLDAVKRDSQYLASSYQLNGWARAESNGGSADGLSIDDWKQQFTGNVVALLEAHPEYQQIQYVDISGRELLRISRGEEEGDPVRVAAESELVDVAADEHIIEMMEIEQGDLHVEKFELNHGGDNLGGGTHVGSAVFDEAGNRQGIIVTNVSSEQVVDLLEEVEEDEVDEGEDEALYLVDAEGYYIHHPDETKMWGAELGHDGSLQSDYEAAAVETILSGESGVVESGSNLLAYAKVDPDPTHEGEHFYIAESLPKQSVYGSVNAFRTVALLVSLLALALVLPFGIWQGRRLIGLIEQLINGISTSSQQIFSTVSEQERIASQQAASVSETSTTMEELEASSRQSAEQAMAAVDAAKTALDRAEVGSQAVNETLAGMFTLEQKVNAIAQQIVNLSGQAGEIGSISQLVSDFANQTNMLALNSSVEAVRAGEHGRGFAVVANEIRKLSEQSQRSADKINALVAEIQKLINKTVMVTEEGTKTAKSGVKVAKLTEQAFADIKQSIDAVVLNNQQVSLTQKQQVNAIRQVVTAMETIDRSSKESATGLSQTRSGTEQLNETARSLRDMM